MHKTITEEQLSGLMFHTSEKRFKEENGKEIPYYVPAQIPMKPEHVLSAKEVGDITVIVSKDGRKHRIGKPEEGKEEGKKKEKKKSE